MEEATDELGGIEKGVGDAMNAEGVDTGKARPILLVGGGGGGEGRREERCDVRDSPSSSIKPDVQCPTTQTQRPTVPDVSARRYSEHQI